MKRTLRRGLRATWLWIVAAASLAALGCPKSPSDSGLEPLAISGRVVAGPVAGATVSVYSVDAQTRALALAGTATTDASGAFSIAPPPGPYLCLASGGSYRDEATGAMRALGASAPGTLDDARPGVLEAFVGSGGGGPSSLNLTPLSTMATRRVAFRSRTDATAFAEASVAAVNLAVGVEFGLGSVDVRTVTPLDFTSLADRSAIQSSPTSTAALLGAVLGGLSRAATNAGVQDPLSFVEALARDFEDGVFNGQAPTGVATAFVEVALETGKLSPTAGTTDLAAATAQFLDDPGANQSGQTSSAYTTLTQDLSTPSLTPLGNAPPAFGIVAGVTVDEDAGQQSITLTAITAGSPAEDATQTVSFTAASSDTSLIPDASLAIDGTGATRTLRFAARPDAAGPATITVTIGDGSLTFARSFLVTVRAVNDAPAFDVISNHVMSEDAASHSLTVTGVGAGGGAGEASQVVSFAVVFSDPTLVPSPLFTGSGTTRELSCAPAANRSGTVTVTVTARDDGGTANGGVDTITRTFTITVEPVNDPPALDAISSPAPIAEDAGPQTVSLSGISAGPGESQALTVTVASDDPALIPTPTATYASPGATGTLAYTPAPERSGTATITVTVTDDATAGGGALSTARQFTITVNPVNDPPAVDAISSPAAVDEDAGLQTVNLSGISAGPNESQTLTILVASDNPALIPTPTATYASPGASGTLAYAPAPDRSGTATITVTVTDDATAGGAALGTSRQFTVTVSPVNDPPALGAISSQVVAANAGPQAVPLSGISAGPLESQTLTVTVASDNPALISTPTATYTSPGATGTLAYTPAPNATGTATITVTVTDDGTAGGAALGASRQFTITVNPAPAGVLTLAGTAATGGPVENAVVTIRDRQGHVVTAMTDTEGRYTANVFGFEAPFLLHVQSAAGQDLYSVGTTVTAGVVNIHPYTDLMVRACYDADGQKVDTVFPVLAAASPVPRRAGLDAIESVVRGILSPYLVRNGIPPERFDPISTTFSADHAGFDAVLDATTVTRHSYLVEVGDAVATSTANVAVSAGSVAITSTTTATTAEGGTSTAAFSAAIPVTDELQAAIDGVQATLDQFKAIVNAHAGAQDLSYDHLTPLFRSDYFHCRLARDESAGQLAQAFRGLRLDGCYVRRVESFDGPNQLLGVRVAYVVGVEVPVLPNVFKLDGGVWKFYGNQKNYNVNFDEVALSTRWVRRNGTSQQFGLYLFVSAPPNALQSVTITGGPWTNESPSASPVQYEDIQMSPTRTDTFQSVYFQKEGQVSTLPTAGDPIEYKITYSNGATEVVTGTFRAVTTEPVIMTVTAGTFDIAAVRGTTVTATWEIPRTFAVRNISVAVNYSNGTAWGNVAGLTTPAAGGLFPTSAQMDIPDQLNGLDVTQAQLEVVVNGLDGEWAKGIWVFDSPPPVTYQGSAAAGDFVRVTLDATAATYSYWNLTTGYTEQGTTATTPEGFKTFTPAAGGASKIRQATEVPGAGVVLIADSTGAAQDKTSLVFAVPQCPITVADISSGALPDLYNFLQLRTRDGGFWFGELQIQNTATTSTLYAPYYNAVITPAAGDLGAAQNSADGTYLTLSAGGGQYVTLFKTATPGLLGIDRPDGGVFAVKQRASKDFAPAWAGTYRGLYYKSSGTVGTPEAAGTAVTATMTVTADGKFGLVGQNGWQDLALTPMADAGSSLARVLPGVYTPDNLGAFKATSLVGPGGADTRETFVIFLDGGLLFGAAVITGENTGTQLNGLPAPTTYTYRYGVALRVGAP